MNVLDYKNKLNSISVQSILKDAVNRHSFQIIQLNQIELDQGKNYLGQIVGKYAKSTELISKTENPRQPKKAGQPYNFEYTGALFDKMFIKYDGKVIIINSNGLGDNAKQLFLEINKALGFTKESSDMINWDILLPELQLKVKQILS